MKGPEVVEETVEERGSGGDGLGGSEDGDGEDEEEDAQVPLAPSSPQAMDLDAGDVDPDDLEGMSPEAIRAELARLEKLRAQYNESVPLADPFCEECSTKGYVCRAKPGRACEICSARKTKCSFVSGPKQPVAKKATKPK